MVLVGGVPGAGKTTAIAHVAGLQPGIRPLDPDDVRHWLRLRLPAGTPYRLYRPLVHTVHMVRVLWHLLRGPVDDRLLVVHDPATRPVRRRLVASLARSRGWQPTLMLVDVTESSARNGQIRRGRVLATSSFRAHWERWLVLRRSALAAEDTVPLGNWHDVVIVDRAVATSTLLRLCSGSDPSPVPPPRPVLAAGA